MPPKALPAARAGLADAQNAQNVPPPNPYLDQVARNVHDAQKAMVDQQANNSAFMRLMNQASIAMLDGRFDDARTSYIQALELATGPGAGPVLVHSAGEPWAPPFAQAAPSDSAHDSHAALDGLWQANFQKAMADGDRAMRVGNYSAAVLDFQAALRQRPNDCDAASGLRQARAFCG